MCYAMTANELYKDANYSWLVKISTFLSLKILSLSLFLLPLSLHFSYYISNKFLLQCFEVKNTLNYCKSPVLKMI